MATNVNEKYDEIYHTHEYTRAYTHTFYTYIHAHAHTLHTYTRIILLNYVFFSKIKSF